MNEVARKRVPSWFWVVSGLALLWNLLGVTMYLMQALHHPAAAPANAAEQQLQASMPAWVMGAYAIAVFAGAAGCIGLLLRKRWAKILLGLSLLAVIVQQLWVLVLSNAREVMGGAVGVSAMVLIVSALLLWLAIQADKKGWLA